MLELWRPRLAWWLRGGIVLFALVWIGVFAIGWSLDPYEHGRARLMETHTQLGLQPCTFNTLAGFPCPSCGMTTSFALFVRGDLANSLRANFAGTLLAGIGTVYVVWGLATAWLGRWAWIRDPEPWLLRCIILFVSAMMIRWGIVLLTRSWT